MEELGLVEDLAVVCAAAVIGGAAARLLKLPAVIGYLAAGIAIGPNTPGPAGDIEDVQTIADLGVALLMFSLGIQFSIRELGQLRGLAAGGVTIVVGTVAIGAAVAGALGISTEQAIIAGMAVSISSSMIALRLMEDGALIGAAAGRVTITLSLVQDMMVIVMLSLIPVLAGNGGDAPADLGIALAKAAAIMVGVWVIGRMILPRVMGRIAVSRSRELFLLTVLALALGTAALSAEAGLSLAFGAFLAGLVISESEYAHRTIVEVFPLKEVFAVVFFVAIGMLIQPDSFTRDLDLVLGMTIVAVFIKMGLIGGLIVAFRYPLRTAFPAAISMANTGEFSFVIAASGVDEGILQPEANDAVLASMLLTLVVSPLLFAVHGRLLAAVRAAPIIGAALRPHTAIFLPDKPHLVNHAIIVGFTQAGREVAAALRGRGFRYAVIDEDPAVFRELSREGTPVVMGNAAMPALLEQASVERARVVAITVTDPGQVESVAATARQLNKRVDVIARGIAEDSHVRLRKIGVTRVVESEFEVGVQFVRHTLQRFGITSQEVQVLLLGLRRNHLGESDSPR